MKSIIVREKDQPSIWLLRDHLTPLLSPEHTGGLFAVAKGGVHPNDGPPPHVHRREDEAFYVLEGEMTFLHGDRLVRAPAGTFVWAPRDVIHCFKCTSATPAKQLLFVSPPAFLEFAMTLAKPAPDFLTPPDLDEITLGKLMQVAPQYGIEMLPGHALPAVVSDAARPRKRVWALGEDVSYLATSEDTGGRFSIVEIRTAPNGGPPPHVHSHQDEMFYLLEGEHAFLLDDGSRHVLHPGDLCFVPRGSVHTFSNTGPTTGRLLDLHTPGGFEKFFDEIGIPHAGETVAPATPVPGPDQAIALFARHGMTLG